MKKTICVVAVLAATVLAAGSSSAATSSPATGAWNGHLKGVSPQTAVSFTVAKSGSRRVVSLFASSGSFTEQCPGAHGASTSVSSVPSATVSGGRFKAATSIDNGFGLETWTVSGAFTSTHAAAGTVVIALAIDSTHRCNFTVKWTATLEPPSPPVADASYRGTTGNDQAGGGAPVNFHVSADGTKLTSFTFTPPVSFGPCPGAATINPPVTEHNLPIHGGKFAISRVSGKVTHGTGTSGTITVTGQFLAGRKAVGTVSTVTDEAGTLVCRGSNTWTAHA